MKLQEVNDILISGFQFFHIIHLPFNVYADCIIRQFIRQLSNTTFPERFRPTHKTPPRANARGGILCV